MFTGIIEEVGTLLVIKSGNTSLKLRIQAHLVLEGTKTGDSIAVNGTCLTVTSLEKDYFEADVMTETFYRTTLGKLKIGQKVNLERAMLANGRFGGHIVAGHVDGIGTIENIEKDEISIWYTVSAKLEILQYIVEKGSITIDGISLTIAYVDDEIFKVSIIPHTQKSTTLTEKKIKDEVNLETDIIGKYVEKLLKPQQYNHKKSKITENFLLENGFI